VVRVVQQKSRLPIMARLALRLVFRESNPVSLARSHHYAPVNLTSQQFLQKKEADPEKGAKNDADGEGDKHNQQHKEGHIQYFKPGFVLDSHDSFARRVLFPRWS
jgi:hypothetical protein